MCRAARLHVQAAQLHVHTSAAHQNNNFRAPNCPANPVLFSARTSCVTTAWVNSFPQFPAVSYACPG
eukprot:10824271-Alexandrium_andersonii.AAC.1